MLTTTAIMTIAVTVTAMVTFMIVMTHVMITHHHVHVQAAHHHVVTVHLVSTGHVMWTHGHQDLIYIPDLDICNCKPR